MDFRELQEGHGTPTGHERRAAEVLNYDGLIRGRIQMPSSELNAKELAQRGESLIRHSSNRYLTTVRIAFRAKQRRFDDFDGLLDDSMIKPVQRAIVELSDEQDQPDLLPG
jgi:DNA-directed RNA polymerase subunit omega